MSAKIKLWAYAVLVILAIWFGFAFHSNYTAISSHAGLSSTNETAEASSTSNRPDATTNAAAPLGQTNVSSPGTNSITSSNETVQTTNETVQTNGLAATNQPVADGAASNAVEQTTNVAALPPVSPASSNAAASPAPQAAQPGPAPVRSGRTVGYLAALVLVLSGLGVLIAHDVTQFMGGRAVDFLFNDRGDGVREPEYEDAEQVWAKGDFLEAIQMLRDYLKKNPREQHVALRIAEIYEKDLHNFLAAALEYEEVLKNKLPPERWGWAAIHLCNLYSRMGQPAKSIPLLERIASEYPKTAAAKKARIRLGLVEPEAKEEQPAEVEAEASSQPSHDGSQSAPFEVVDPGDQPLFEEELPAEEEPPPPERKSNLPPGFRPKK